MRFFYPLVGLGLAAALLTAGCGDDRPGIPFQPEQEAAAPAPRPIPTPAAPAPTPPPIGESDPLATPDQLTAGVDGTAKDPGDVASPGNGDALANDMPTPTAYRHWLTVSQFGAQVRLRVNGIAQGGGAASTTTDVTMVMHPGANAVTVEYEPKTADAWARVYITRDPPLPQVLLFDSSTSKPPTPPVSDVTVMGRSKTKPLTKTCTVLVR